MSSVQESDQLSSEVEAAADTLLHCHRCRTVNPATRKFCTSCGGPLWAPCIHCGTLCVVGERFCGACGTDLEDDLRGRTGQFEDDLRRAAELQDQSRFDEALKILGAVAQADHPRLAPLIARANQQIKELTARRDAARTLAEKRYQEAQQAMGSRDAAAALRAMESVSGPLRTPPMEQLLSELRAQNAEADELDRTLHQAVAARHFDGLLSKVGRLLELRPGHAAARKVAAKLQERLCGLAEAKLAACKYEEGLKLVEQVPESLRLPTTQQLHDKMADLAWMARELRQAPVANPALLAIGERMRAASPADSRAAKLCGELQRRTNVAAKAPRLEDPPWAAPPQEPFLGFPVERPAGLRRIAFREEFDPAIFRESSGSFFVAVGLALQAAGQAAVDINLLPLEDRGVLHKLSQVMRMRIDRSGRIAWGIDLGCSGLKAVKLAWDERKHQATVVEADYCGHRKPLSQAVNAGEEDAIIDETLRQFVGQNNVKADRIAIGLPGNLTLSRQWRLPPADPAKVDSLVRHEAALQMPFPLDQLAWDYHVWDSPSARETTVEEPPAKKRGLFGREHREKEESDVLLVVVKRKQAQRRLERFHQFGLYADIAQSDCLALYNWLAFEYFQPGKAEGPAQAEEEAAIAVLDVGSDATNFVVGSSRTCWFRNLGFGGQGLTRALVQAFQLTVAQAEQWKTTPTLAPSLCRLYATMDPLFADLAKEIGTSLELFAKANPEERIGRALLVGGSGRLHGLLRYLRLGR